MVDSPQQMRTAQATSFGRAMDDMTANLQRELGVFKERVKEQKAPVRVVKAEGGGGAGAWDFGALGIALLAFALRRKGRPAAPAGD
jgi:rhombotail lipoprotein